MKTKFRFTLLTLLVAGFMLVLTLDSPVHAKSKTIEIVLSTYWPTSYGYLIDPLINFATNVENESGGRVKIKFYHSGQLFKGKEEFAAVERGDIDMSAPLDIYQMGIVPELGIGSLPFMWDSPASLQKTLDAGLWDLGVKEKILKHNMVVLGVAAGGPYQIYAKDFEVKKPGDMKGKKWGVSGSTASKAMELLGGAPTTMSSGELYMALQRGTIDGCTRPLLTGLGRKLYEVVDHLSVTNMAYFCSFLVINKEKWQSLPQDIQEIMKKAARQREQEQLQRLNAFLKEALELYQEKGVKVHIASSDELAKFKAEMQSVYDWWLNKVPDGRKYIEFAQTRH